jgi:membrane protease subunit HflK
MYLETMEQVLGNVDKVIIDKGVGSNGVVPYLPLQPLSDSGVGPLIAPGSSPPTTTPSTTTGSGQ